MDWQKEIEESIQLGRERYPDMVVRVLAQIRGQQSGGFIFWNSRITDQTIAGLPGDCRSRAERALAKARQSGVSEAQIRQQFLESSLTLRRVMS